MSEGPTNKGRIEQWLTVGMHLVAIVVLAVGSAALFANEASAQALVWAWHRGAHLGALATKIAEHVGLCAVAWLAIVASYRSVAKLVAQLRDGERTVVRLDARRGSVMTETLIVLPVALLLIMGLAQLTLINIAATLSDLAVIEAARSVWVWAPEADEGRMGVDRSLVKEKARVQAAAVLAPVASSDFGHFSKGSTARYNGTFRKAMGAIYGAQVDNAGNDIGSYATSEAETALSANKEAIGKNMAFNLAFDSTSFKDRSARKFFNAWAHTEVSIVDSGDWIGAKMTYHHACLLPLVAGLFGQYDTVNGDVGYYTNIQRAYTLRKQVQPNATLPRN